MGFRGKVLIGPSSFAEHDKCPLVRLRDAGFEVVENPYKRKLTKAELLDLLTREVIGLIAGLEPIDREVLSHSKLRVVSRVGSGMSNVDQVAARELGIAVCSTPDAPTESVAELTIGALLGLLRHVPQMDAAMHRGEWTKRTGFLLSRKVVAIIGFGRIGRRVSQLLAPFRTRTIAVDPCAGIGEEAVEKMSLREALPLADVLTLHASGDSCLLGPEEFGLMKKGVFILNVARGNLISEAELAGALRSGIVAGAWLDTFASEPYGGELSSLSNVILTPHVGSYTVECRRAMEIEATDNLLVALTGPRS